MATALGHKDQVHALQLLRPPRFAAAGFLFPARVGFEMRRKAYAERIAEALLGRIAAGESLRVICRDEGMPSAWAVLRRLGEDEAFARRFAKAREAQADSLFEELQAIADEGNPSDNTRARLRVDTLKWRLARMNVSPAADARCVVPVGFVRAHDAAVVGLPDIAAAAGQSDEAASGLELSAVARTVAGNYGACREAAEQVTGWQDFYRQVQSRMEGAR